MMTSYWLISGRYEHLRHVPRLKAWAFSTPDPDQRGKFYEFWTGMRGGDLVALQALRWKDGWEVVGIVGFARVARRYYDSATLSWPDEIEEGRCIYPHKVEFLTLILLKEDSWSRMGITFAVPDERYARGVGLGLIEPEEFNVKWREAEQKWGLSIML